MVSSLARCKHLFRDAACFRVWCAALLLHTLTCIVPLVLISLGVSGAWIGQLTALEPYKPLFLLVAIGFLAAGFWDVYFRKTSVCEDGSYCARLQSSVVKQVALWSGALVVLAALTIDVWAPLFY